MTKESKEFLERKKLLSLTDEYGKKKHDRKMEELNFIRETQKLGHDQELERGRIKSAEIRKAQERRELSEMRRWKS